LLGFCSGFAFACAVLFSIFVFLTFFSLGGMLGNSGFVHLFLFVVPYFANFWINFWCENFSLWLVFWIFSIFEKFSFWLVFVLSLIFYVFENFLFWLVFVLYCL